VTVNTNSTNDKSNANRSNLKSRRALYRFTSQDSYHFPFNHILHEPRSNKQPHNLLIGQNDKNLPLPLSPPRPLATVLAASVPLQPRNLAEGAIAQSTVNQVHGGCTSYLYYGESVEDNKSCWAAALDCGWLDTWTTASFVVGNSDWTWNSLMTSWKILTNAKTTSDSAGHEEKGLDV